MSNYRLSKVCKQLNIGVDRAVEFLQGKGHEVGRNPNTKISDEQHDLLLSNFQLDMSKKEKSEMVSLQKKQEKEEMKGAKEEAPKKEKSEVIRAKASISGLKVVDKMDLDKKPTPEPVAPPTPEIQPEVVKTATEKPAAEEEKPAPVPEKVPTVEAAPKQAEPEAKVEQQQPERKADEKVAPVAPIDPPKQEAHVAPEPSKEAAAKEVEKVVEAKKETVAPTDSAPVAAHKEEAPKPAPVVPKTEAVSPKKVENADAKHHPNQNKRATPEAPKAPTTPKAAEAKDKLVATPAPTDAAPAPSAETPSDSNVIKTTYQKLEGPKFTGAKIDLSQFNKPKKKKVASSAGPANKDANKNKRKRKRIPNEGQPGAPNQGAQTPGAARPAPGAPGAPGAKGKTGTGNNRPIKPINKANNRKPGPKAELTDEDIQKQIKETLEKLTGSKKSKGSKIRKARRDERREKEAINEMQRESENKILKATEFVTVSELATMMDVPTNKVIGTLMSLGIMVTMNQRLDAEILTLVAEEFGFEVDFVDADVTESVQIEEDIAEDLLPRSPIVTVMGHVDHGKTSLLDYIRKANVIAGEAGGITQHIGAYSVAVGDQQITFLDTPGHEAFTAMRARGAQVTDVAIIVVAADDDVMPQTKEAISHAQAANVPIVFAINKIDKPNANPEKVKEKLAGMNLLVDSWGGPISSMEISAKHGTNVNELLEKVLLEAEVLELKANPNRRASGTVIEASLDKGRGYLATILVQTGTLKVGDYVLAGQYSGKVKAMLDERGNRVEEAGPSKPVSMLGLDGAPQAGDNFLVMTDEKEAKGIAAKRMQLQREQSVRTQKNLTLEEIGRRLALGDFQELNLIIKGDVDGSVEALSDSLQRLSTDEIQVNVVHKAVGQISESDILLAAASNAIIVGFQVRPSSNSRKLAEKENVEIRLYSIIYDAINEIKDAMEGMLSPEIKEEITCNVEIRETFKISKVGTIAGCMVLDGTITRNTRIRIIRDGVVVYTGELGSLKRFKDDVKEVNKGYECGLNIKNFNDVKVGDIIEGFKEVEVKKTL
ncbi:MAG: translation initiation factor IF-2 [Schleiferiaceae bacterium]|nr:translation initiation factor IF-2 [Schleiferiaceae bacterium]